MLGARASCVPEDPTKVGRNTVGPEAQYYVKVEIPPMGCRKARCSIRFDALVGNVRREVWNPPDHGEIVVRLVYAFGSGNTQPKVFRDFNSGLCVGATKPRNCDCRRFGYGHRRWRRRSSSPTGDASRPHLTWGIPQ